MVSRSSGNVVIYGSTEKVGGLEIGVLRKVSHFTLIMNKYISSIACEAQAPIKFFNDGPKSSVVETIMSVVGISKLGLRKGVYR